MITEIAGVMSSLKAAGNITKALVGLRDAEALQAKVIELQAAIMAAQSSALGAQSAQTDLVDQVRDLEKQIADLEAWGREKQRYHLVDANSGRGSVFVYALTPEAQGAEPMHCLCAKCYEDGKKSIIQSTSSLIYGIREHICHRCNSTYVYAGFAGRRS